MDMAASHKFLRLPSSKYVRLHESHLGEAEALKPDTKVVVVTGPGAHRGKVGILHTRTGDKCAVYFGYAEWDDRAFNVDTRRLRPATEDEADYFYQHRWLLVADRRQDAVWGAFMEANPLRSMDDLKNKKKNLARNRRVNPPPPGWVRPA